MKRVHTFVARALLGGALLTALGVSASPAKAAIVYNNDFGGVISTDDFAEDAWTINFTYLVSDSFSLATNSNVAAFTIALWAIPGDVLNSLSWAITTAVWSGTTVDANLVAVPTSQTVLETNPYGYQILQETFSTSPGDVFQANTTYWLQLSNASVTNGDPISWDQSDGPSVAYSSEVGMLPDTADGYPCNGLCTGSESFELLGTASSVPEPSSLFLFVAPILGTIAFSVRKRFRTVVAS